ncbi:SirB1 family protein [Tundrisphaera sp. TA3]|uniref:SirB1 family protein n=1 Tax=Tundrisphaera sp. TA3 TaxID=3435775 RepID=UPI003EB86D1F
MRDPFPETTEFGRLIRGVEPIDLVGVSLEIARDAYPGLDAGAILGQIDALARRVRERCGDRARPEQVIGQINWVLFIEEEFRGNVEDYQDPKNSYINEVLARKLGIPISLSVLYATLAGRVGLRLSGVNLPLHFLLRIDEPGPARFVDPFHRGAILDHRGCESLLARISGRAVTLHPEHLAPCAATTIVARMLRNLKGIYLQQADPASTLPVIRRLAALQRDDPGEQRDWGMACLQADRPGESIGPLQRYLQAMPEADDVEAVRILLRGALREVALRN